MRCSIAALFAAVLADIVAVGVMTDSGDDSSTRRAFYGDITFRSGE